MNTDEADHITPEERKDLMGFCEKCQVWDEVQGRSQHSCGTKWSNKNGHQLTTKRTFASVKRK